VSPDLLVLYMVWVDCGEVLALAMEYSLSKTQEVLVEGLLCASHPGPKGGSALVEATFWPGQYLCFGI
jgi:hypothetical protein